MLEQIKQKLARALCEPINSEHQVVYILVEIRKVLEILKPSCNGDYFALSFYADWAVHACLDRAGARAIVQCFDTHQCFLDDLAVANNGDRIQTTDESVMQQLEATLQLTNFREQLRTFLRQFDLPSTISDDQRRWTEFLIQYTSVVEDCPLLCIANPPLERVDQVTISVIHTPHRPVVPNRQYDFTLAIQWNWLSKKTGIVHATQQFFYSEAKTETAKTSEPSNNTSDLPSSATASE
jgi:hypothetical protein